MSGGIGPLSSGSSLLSKWKLESSSSPLSGLSLSSTGLRGGLSLGGLGSLALKSDDASRKRKGYTAGDKDVKKTKESSHVGQSSLLSTELSSKLSLTSSLTSSRLSTGHLSGGLTSSLTTSLLPKSSKPAPKDPKPAKKVEKHVPLRSRVKKDENDKSRTVLKKRAGDAGAKQGGKVAKSFKAKKSKEPGFNFGAYETSYPEYNFTGMSTEKALELPTFLPPDQDVSISRHLHPLHDVNGMKNALINAVSASLICSPNFKNRNDGPRQDLIAMTERVIPFDPEFVLKVALYTRKGLNIRTTANFLLALAANVKSCRPYMKKYFCASINLPSDWIEVAEIYQAFHDDSITFGALPAALRRVMIAKFPEFDKYQLAKYNKDSSKKKKKKNPADGGSIDRGGRGRGRGRGRGQRGGIGQKRYLLESDAESDSDEEDDKKARRQVSDVAYDEDSDNEETIKQKTFTLKQLIRKLHIREPVEHVMCLIGKKYPDTLEEFYASRLPGTWEEERAGKRMKLPIPETWETQVSMLGNKAEVWEKLIDNKKLPFMAMLRNLRNLIKAGISPKHHNSIISRLTNERQVVNSKQFPFRFFSAYEVLTQLEKDYEKNQKDIIYGAEKQASEGGFRGRGRGRGRGRSTQGGPGGGKEWWLKRLEKKKATIKEVQYDTNIIVRYRKALDTAVKIATTYNVQPIKGRTIIFCDISEDMKVNCTAGRGLGKPRTMDEVAVLLGLMCKYSCEDCIFIVYNKTEYAAVDIARGTILDNMDTVLNTPMSERSGRQPMEGPLPYGVLVETLRDRIQVDTLIVLSGGIDPTEGKGLILSDFLKMYRQVVNPNLLYCSVSFAVKSTGFATNIKPEHDNDIYITGYSDQILRFIAERGDGGQLLHVEKIDEAFNLAAISLVGLEKTERPTIKVSPEKLLQISSQTPRWRTARVFISSTFRDMHGERDLLTRFVFPELRERGRKHFINVYEVDLRWGVTEEVTKLNRTLLLCLQELTKCQFFLGILGNRYGWVPDNYDVPDTEHFDWVREYPRGASVTELEMYCAALSKPNEVKDKAFFFIRDDSFEKDVPKEFTTDFVTEDVISKERLSRLKNRVRSSGLEVFDGYPCTWGGSVDHKPIVSGLSQFGMRVLNNLWTAIQTEYPDEDAMLDEDTHIAKLHQAFVESRRSQFIGRKALIKQCINKIVEMDSGLLTLAGKPGTGKTSLVASLVHSYIESRFCDSASTVLVHIVGAAPGSQNIMATLKRLCHEINRQFGLQSHIPQDYKNLVVKFKDLLTEAGKLCGSTMVVVMDGLDLMEEAHQPYNMEWLPKPIPENVVFVMSVVNDEKCHKSLQRLNSHEIVVTGLDMFDKAEVVRTTLAEHRKVLSETPFNNQLKLITSKKEAHNPLFLKLACEELRVFGVFDKIGSKLKSLPHTTPQLLQEIMTRLETDHGKEVVSTALSLLACVRDGIEIHEMRHLLAWKEILGDKFILTDFDNIDVDVEDLMPPATFSYLSRSIQEFLNPTAAWSDRLSIGHAEILTAIRQRYLRGAASDKELILHRLLAGFFQVEADPEKNRQWRGNSTRAFSELPHHLAAAGCYAHLESVICDLGFIQAKCRRGLASQLLDDFLAKVRNVSKTQEKELAKFHTWSAVKAYTSFVSRNLHILSRYPTLTLQQALNEPGNSQVVEDAMDRYRGEAYMQWNNKPAQTDSCYLNISNLPQPTTCVAISSDNQYFATGGKDCLVRLYSLETGKELRSFRGHSDAISDVCFVGKGTLCSASLDNTVSLWHVEDGHRLGVLKGHGRRVNSCAADQAGKVVVSAAWDSQVRVWDVNKKETVCYLSVGSPVNCVDVHPEGQLIVTGNWDSTIKIFDIFHKSRKAVLRGHSSSVRDVAYSPSGRHIASASMDGEVKLWSATNGSQVGNIAGHALPINKLTFTPTGQELVTVSDDHMIKVWSGHLGVPLLCLGSEKNGPVTSTALSPVGDLVAAGYHEGHVRVFDVNTGVQYSEVNHHKSAVRAMAYSRDGRYLFTGADNGDVMMLDGTLATKTAALVGHSKPVLCVTTTTKYVATCGEDFVCLIFPSPKECKKDLRVSPVGVLRGHTGPVTSCTFSPDKTKIATASRDSDVMIWDMFTVLVDPSPTPITTVHACHNDWINSCVWSNIGDFLVTGSNDFNLKVWDIKTGTEKTKLTGHLSAVNSVAYQYGCIVSACSDGTVKVWSHKGTEITTLHGHSQRVNSCDIVVKVKQGHQEAEDNDEEEEIDWASAPEIEPQTNKSSKLDVKLQDVVVATCSDDGLLRVWKPLQANELASLTGHSDRVVSVATDKSGNICSCSLDRSVRLWSPQLSEERVIGRHDAEVTFCVSSLNGSVVLSGSRDGMVKVWTEAVAGNKRTCSYSFKASEKSVNAACFLNKKGTIFAVGSDEGTIILWDLLQKKEAYQVRKGKVFETNTPVTSLTCNESVPAKSGHTFFSGEWDGSIKVWNTNYTKHVTSHNRCNGSSGFHRHWVTKMKFVGNDLVTTDSNSEVIQLDVTSILHGQYDNLYVRKVDKIDSLKVDKDVPPHKVKKTWVLDVQLINNKLHCVDSKGQITLISNTIEEDLVVKEIHGEAITAIASSSKCIFTASRDGTVKVWDKSIIQIGQFFCPAPITSMCVTTPRVEGETPILCGDQLGNIHLLTWRQA